MEGRDRIGKPVILDAVNEIIPKRDENGQILPGQPGFGWKLSEQCQEEVAELDRYTIRG